MFRQPRALSSLSADEIIRRLENTDNETVNDIYDLAIRQLNAEDVASARIDSRATSLFGAVGVSITLMFSFGGWILLNKSQLVFPAISYGFLIIHFFGVITAICALAGLLLRKNNKALDENDVFSIDVLTDGKSQRDFRMHVATHAWVVWQGRFKGNEGRALVIMLGQICFVAFLLLTLGLSVIIVIKCPKQASPNLADKTNVVFLGTQPYGSVSVPNPPKLP